MIDRKYKILAVSPCSGDIHTEDDAILFLARDRAVVHMLEEYYKQCKHLGCEETHLETIDLLVDRVIEYQRTKGMKVPDTETPCEIARCIDGKV